MDSGLRSRVGRKATSIKRNRLRCTNVHNVQMKTVKIACFRAVVSVLYMLRKEKKRKRKSTHFSLLIQFMAASAMGGRPWIGCRTNTERQITIHVHIYTCSQFIKANCPCMHVFALWEEAGVCGEQPRRHRENMHGFNTQDCLVLTSQCNL